MWQPISHPEDYVPPIQSEMPSSGTGGVPSSHSESDLTLMALNLQSGSDLVTISLKRADAERYIEMVEYVRSGGSAEQFFLEIPIHHIQYLLKNEIEKESI